MTSENGVETAGMTATAEAAPHEAPPAQTEAPVPTAAAAGLSKQKMASMALDALGERASVAELRDYIVKTFGVEMTPGHVSTAKNTILHQRQREGQQTVARKRLGRPPKASKATAPVVASHAATLPAARAGLEVRDVRLVSEMAQRLGAKSLRELVEAVLGAGK